MMYKIADLSHDNTHRITKFTWKIQTRKKIIESLANPLLSRDYKEKKKTSQSLFTIALTVSLNPNYCASSFIEKSRVTNCDIAKLSLTRGLNFLYREASRLDGMHCASLYLGDVPLLCPSECAPPETPSDPPSTWTCHNLKLQARPHSLVVCLYSRS